MSYTTFVAIPCYTGSIIAQCAQSLIGSMSDLSRRGIGTQVFFQLNDCYLPNARNACVDAFLKTDCGEMIFVDADLQFDADALYKVLSVDAPIVCGAYPAKYAPKWTCEPYMKDGYPELDKKTGLIRAKYGPTGLMKIQRTVFDQMRDANPGWKAEDTNIVTYFDTGFLFNGDHKWYGEDVAFCRRWHQLGGDVLIDPTIHFSHIGTQPITGCYSEFLAAFYEDMKKRLGRGVTE